MRAFLLGRRWRVEAALVAILLVATWLRFFRIGELPPGFHFDLASNAFDIARIYLGDFRIFFPANTGREPLFIYLQALAALPFGLERFPLQLTSAFVGVATTALLYRFTWRLMNSQEIALLASLFAAISFWHVFYSRLGLRAILVVPLTILAVWMLWEGISSLRLRYFALGGAALAMAIYTYTSARLLPVIPILVLIWAMMSDRSRVAVYLRGGALMLLVTAVLLLPLGWYFWINPDDFMVRSGYLSILNPEISGGNSVGTLATNIGLVLNMFLVAGDQSIIRNLPGRPVFDPLVGILFVLGTGVMLVTLLGRRTERMARFRAMILLVWTVVGLMPTVLSGEAPSFIRAIAMLPAAMILTAWGTWFLWERMRGKLRYVAVVGLALVVGFSLVSTYTDYFRKFAEHPEVQNGFDVDNVQIAEWINRNVGGGQVFLAPVLYQQITIAFLTRMTDLKSFDSRDTLVLAPAVEGTKALYAFPREQLQRVETTAMRMPGGERKDLLNEDGAPLLYVYDVPSTMLPRGSDAVRELNLSPEPGQVNDSSATWENGIRLWGSRIVAAGLGRRQLQVILYLEPRQPIAEDLTFSIKVTDADGRVWGQEDKMTGSNSYPTRWWTPNEMIIERFYPEAEECPPPGDYRVTAGLYNLETGQVFSIPGTDGGAAVLGTIHAVENCAWNVENESNSQ